MSIDTKAAAKKMLESVVDQIVTCPACGGDGFGPFASYCKACHRVGLLTKAEAARYMLTESTEAPK